jgi:hypothetical protein
MSTFVCFSSLIVEDYFFPRSANSAFVLRVQRSCYSATASFYPIPLILSDKSGSYNKFVIRRIWLGPESNRRHVDFQSTALPTELPSLNHLKD